MIIDLDSWETGYADGKLGWAPECPTREGPGQPRRRGRAGEGRRK